MEIINVTVEAEYIVGVPELNELLSVRTFIALALPTEEFIELFKVVLEGKTLWNSFTLDRFIEVNRNLRMSPPRQLHHVPPPPPIPQGTSARAIASRCKTLSKLMVEACEANKSFLMSTIDKKEYSWTLLVDNGSTEGARFTGTFRFTPRREGRSGRSPRRDRSPCCDSPRPSSRDGTNQRLELIAPLDRLLHPDRWVLLLSSHLLLLDLVAIILFKVRLPDRNMLSLGILLQGHRCLEGKFSSLEADLRSLSDSKQKLEDRVDHLSSELMKSNGSSKPVDCRSSFGRKLRDIVPDDENDVGLEPKTTSEQPPAAEPNETEPAFAEPEADQAFLLEC
ncbi:hypothetical protein AT5G33806 [Arabidopsis thaliana]|uniref:Uncharacterized protein n=1 Tax=Arabidopsis thaliana TaxID=3702 RepID=F4KIN1_ARATH|nr:uncharacterized protein AT5G33806 [Arabidopsis thaliana]AED93904.1 hypothetical protein AT5G33806 [Arabidopsis thaliana]|eukprot:NP_680306.1 hypothetical protein AT5G33806 [Arabidopsis thaliana]